MVNTINIKCPVCMENTELFLSIEPTVLILNCPECWTPLMCDKNNIHVLSEEELQKIVAPSMQSVATKINKSGYNTSSMSHIGKSISFTNDKYNVVFNKNNKINFRKNEITLDNIIDLRIDLAQCEDVDNFLKKLG